MLRAHERDSYARTCHEVRLESVTKIVRYTPDTAKGSQLSNLGPHRWHILRPGCVNVNDDSTVVDNNRHETTW